MGVIRVGVLTISDTGARGERQDSTYAVIREGLLNGPFEIAAYELVPDEAAQIKRVLRLWADRDGLELILTNGSIRLSPRDHTPEATRELLEKEAPGIAEFIRAEAFKRSPMAALSRGVAGIRGKSLIINLPGGPQGARDSLLAILPLLPVAIEKITGRTIPGALAFDF